MTPMSGSVRRLAIDALVVDIANDPSELARLAADDAETTISAALSDRGQANVMLATGTVSPGPPQRLAIVRSIASPQGNFRCISREPSAMSGIPDRMP